MPYIIRGRMIIYYSLDVNIRICSLWVVYALMNVGVRAFCSVISETCPGFIAGSTSEKGDIENYCHSGLAMNQSSYSVALWIAASNTSM